MSTITAPRVERPSLPPTIVRRRPSIAWYWVAGLVAILGVAISVGWGATRAIDAYRSVDSFARAHIPGIVNVTVDEAGKQLVYYEGDRRPEVNELGLEIRDPSGSQIAIRPYLLDLRYDFNGHVGKAVAVFRTKVPGRYAVESSKAPEDDAHLGVGRDLTSMIPIIVAPLGLSLLSLVVGMGIAVVAYIKRTSQPQENPIGQAERSGS